MAFDSERFKSENALQRLEIAKDDVSKANDEKPRIRKIQEMQTIWKDDYDINSLLRKKFREEKIEIQKKEKEVKNFGLPLERLNTLDEVSLVLTNSNTQTI